MSNGNNAVTKREVNEVKSNNSAVCFERPKPRVLESTQVQAKEIRRSENNPRKRFRGITDLQASRRKTGQKKRIEIFRVNDKNPVIKFEIFDGERRWRSCDPEEWLDVDIIERPKSKAAHKWGAYVANNSGDCHTHREKAEALYEAYHNFGLSVADMALELGCSAGTIYDYINLNKLESSLLNLLDDEELPREERLTFREGVELSKATLPQQFMVFSKVIKLPLAVRTAAIRRMINDIKGNPVRKKNATDHRRTLMSFLTRANILNKDVFSKMNFSIVAESIAKKYSAEQMDAELEVLNVFIENLIKLQDHLHKESA